MNYLRIIIDRLAERRQKDIDQMAMADWQEQYSLYQERLTEFRACIKAIEFPMTTTSGLDLIAFPDIIPGIMIVRTEVEIPDYEVVRIRITAKEFNHVEFTRDQSVYHECFITGGEWCYEIKVTDSDGNDFQKVYCRRGCAETLAYAIAKACHRLEPLDVEA